MKVRLKKLRLLCRQQVVDIPLDGTVVLIDGVVAVGKSSVLQLIDYCFGGDYDSDWAPVVRNEVRSARLDATLGHNQVVLERTLGTRRVEVTWRGEGDIAAQFLRVPTAAGEEELIAGVYGLSDLLFMLCGTESIRVPKRASDPDSRLVRLSFRDLMWFCYLPQLTLDSDFFKLYDDARRPKARWALRFITGLLFRAYFCP